MITIKEAYYEVSDFASKFSDAGLAAINMPILLTGTANVIAELSQKYFSFNQPAFVETLELSYAMRLISSPIQALRSFRDGVAAYERSDHVGLISYAVSSVRETMKTCQAILMIDSLVLGAIHKIGTTAVGQILYKGSLYLAPISTFLFGIKTLVSTFEVLSFQAQVWRCKDQKARQDFLKGRLNVNPNSLTVKKVNFVALSSFERTKYLNKVDSLRELPDTIRYDNSLTLDEKIAYFDKMQGKKDYLVRMLGSSGYEHFVNGEMDKVDSKLKWGLFKQIVRISLVAIGAILGALFAANLLPVPMLMLIDICLDLDSLTSILVYINDTIKDLKSDPRAYDRYLVMLGAVVLTGIMLVVGFMHLTPACWVVVGILFLLSLAFMAYTYNKVRPRNELK
ncbi:MAG: hypothetical protein KDK50_05365, partial [Chlamydiia bacterium]|nr:hypothetical protein [Chlamydiia bacterium]